MTSLARLPAYLQNSQAQLLTELKRELTDTSAEQKWTHEDDELMFDLIRPYLPPAKTARYLLLLSILIQIVMAIFLFLGHFSERTTFECCNMWAVFVAILFIVLQFVYFYDWSNIDGDNPAWHRSTLFVPFGLFVVMFIEWGVGTMSMLAHAVDIDVLAADTKDLSHTERAAFIISSGLGILILPLLFALSFAHRNNLGQFYYEDDDHPEKRIMISDFQVPVRGTFSFKSGIGEIATYLKIDTTRRARRYMPRWIRVAVLLQIPFYFFCSIIYTSGNQSNIPIIFLCLGVVSVVSQFHYFSATYKYRKRNTRYWHRQHMVQPVIAAYAMIAAWCFSMASAFFKADDTTPNWETIIPNLTPAQKTYFVISICCISALGVLNYIISQSHRKGWMEGKSDLKAMIETIEDDMRGAEDELPGSRAGSGGVAPAGGMETRLDPNMVIAQRQGLAVAPPQPVVEEPEESEYDESEHEVPIPKRERYNGRRIESPDASDEEDEK